MLFIYLLFVRRYISLFKPRMFIEFVVNQSVPILFLVSHGCFIINLQLVFQIIVYQQKILYLNVYKVTYEDLVEFYFAPYIRNNTNYLQKLMNIYHYEYYSFVRYSFRGLDLILKRHPLFYRLMRCHHFVRSIQSFVILLYFILNATLNHYWLCLLGQLVLLNGCQKKRYNYVRVEFKGFQNKISLSCLISLILYLLISYIITSMPSWLAYCGETGVRHSTTTSCSFCFASPPEILDLTDSPSPIPRTSQSGIQISQRFETYPRSNGDQRIGHLLPSRQRSSYQTLAS